MTYENESRERLIECAKREFLEKGFAKASLRSISAAAGLTTGAVYFFFKDKNGLLGAIVDEPLQRIYQALKAHYSSELKEDFSVYQHTDGDHDELAEQLIPQMYADYDALMILLEKSAGSKYERVVDEIIDLTERYYGTIAENFAAAVPGKQVNRYMLHWFSHVQINAFVHLLTHVRDEQTALREIKPVMNMLIDGWMKYILMDKD
ncbi:MAG: TetR/AcrR family transcriptional regulator [Ruminococcus sp.]|nr:TetR/AcrR family transcriptional regulator [Ruminococcus sp.]